MNPMNLASICCAFKQSRYDQLSKIPSITVKDLRVVEVTSRFWDAVTGQKVYICDLTFKDGERILNNSLSGTQLNGIIYNTSFNAMLLGLQLIERTHIKVYSRKDDKTNYDKWISEIYKSRTQGK